MFASFDRPYRHNPSNKAGHFTDDGEDSESESIQRHTLCKDELVMTIRTPLLEVGMAALSKSGGGAE
ncbi:hypothetical protein N7534_005603 [Penicillium rubens]|nr:hypothetical protein N7534_005603 [Penicillium rubens]